jgi:omega-amidase
VRVACCQVACVAGDLEGNVACAARAVREGLAAKPEMVVLPEAWATGFVMEDLDGCARATPRAMGAVIEAAGDWPGLLVAGSFIVREEGGFYQELRVLRRGEVIAAYRKMHLSQGANERTLFQRGDAPASVETPLGRAGLALCHDLRFPELFRWHARRGARLFVVPTQWPLPRIEHWRLLARARALENLAFFVGVNTAGQPEAERLFGHSLVVDPWGELLWEAGQEETVGTVDLDPERLETARSKLSVLDEIREDPPEP